MSPPDLNLLMVHSDDHVPVLDGGFPEASASAQGGDASDSAVTFWDEGGDPNDLAVQRWGVIAPQGPEGDRLLALIQPLLVHRQEQQGARVRVHRVPARMTQDEAVRWKKREFDDGSDLNIEVPRYQLILGDLDQVPLALQQVQASDGYVGRLAFSAEEDYAAYVDKVLRWERRPTGRDDGRALFFTVHDGTAATAVGHSALVGPGVEIARQRRAAGQYAAREIVEFGHRLTPSPDELLSQAAASDPSVLFTLSHGEGAPRGGWSTPEAQRERQGAMSFGREGRLGAEDLRDRPFMPGGVWFMLACYGAGTPHSSAYKHWLAALAGAGQFRGKADSVLAGLPGPHDRPFIAALPKAVLANSEGPLAFMGHIDLAWTYSFREHDHGTTPRPARYMALTRSILRRDRVGLSMRELLRFFDQTNIELTSLHDQEAEARSMNRPCPVDVARQGHLWMLRQDLAAYVLLGDPAVRLPFGEHGVVDDAPGPASSGALPRCEGGTAMATGERFSKLLRQQLACRAVWPPVLAPIALGDYGVLEGAAFHKLGNLADFGVPIVVETGHPSRLCVASGDVRTHRLVGGLDVPAFHGLGAVDARLRRERRRPGSSTSRVPGGAPRAAWMTSRRPPSLGRRRGRQRSFQAHNPPGRPLRAPRALRRSSRRARGPRHGRVLRRDLLEASGGPRSRAGS